MKLATLKDGTRDGKLVVVSRDLTRFTDASFLARDAAGRARRLAADLAASGGHGRIAGEQARCRRRASMSMTPIRRCRAPINGRTARPM